MPTRIRWLLFSVLVLSPYLSCPAQQSTQMEQITPNTEAFQSDFIARLYSVETTGDATFVAHLQECCLPVWVKLRAEGVLSSITVFELHQRESSIAEKPPWRFLLLAELDPKARIWDFLLAENTSDCCGRIDNSPFKILREEWMSCTSNSCFRIPEVSYRDAPNGIDYLIEFIGVEDSPENLSKYRDLVSNYFGPANGMLVEQGLLHCFVGLETTEVLAEVTSAPGWNQIHISDDWDVGGEVDWDAVYTNLFRHEFNCELDSLWSELPPVRERPIDYLVV